MTLSFVLNIIVAIAVGAIASMLLVYLNHLTLRLRRMRQFRKRYRIILNASDRQALLKLHEEFYTVKLIDLEDFSGLRELEELLEEHEGLSEQSISKLQTVLNLRLYSQQEEQGIRELISSERHKGEKP